MTQTTIVTFEVKAERGNDSRRFETRNEREAFEMAHVYVLQGYGVKIFKWKH